MAADSTTSDKMGKRKRKTTCYNEMRYRYNEMRYRYNEMRYRYNVSHKVLIYLFIGRGYVLVVPQIL